MLADAIGVRNKRRLSIQDRQLSVLRRRSACSMGFYLPTLRRNGGVCRRRSGPEAIVTGD
jgi:hypothetical protein